MIKKDEWIEMDPVILDENSEPIGTWWCGCHKRPATHVDKNGQRHCAPHLGGIMIPCMAELVPALFEMEKGK